MPESLRGRAAVVTGGGRGIGAAVAHALANAGVRVVVAARSMDQVERVASSIQAAGGVAVAAACDVSNEESVLSLHAAAIDAFGPIDILINNAGIGHSQTLVRTTREDWDLVIAVNATGAFLCTRAFLPAMLERAWGRIVNVASMAGLNGAKYITAYTASKHAMIGLTRAVAAEVAGTGVTCNAVCPTFVDTPMTTETISNVVRRTGKSREDMLAMVLATTGQQRLITAEEVAVRVFSLCDVGSFATNGETLVMDGSSS